MRDGDLQSCYYNSTNNVGAATITIGRSSESTIARKGLERSFATDLASTDARLSYKAIADGYGDETIYGYGQRGPSHIYRLRWRVGNELEYSIDVNAYTKVEPAEVLGPIRELAKKL